MQKVGKGILTCIWGPSPFKSFGQNCLKYEINFLNNLSGAQRQPLALKLRRLADYGYYRRQT